jgi:hypothetical protein
VGIALADTSGRRLVRQVEIQSRARPEFAWPIDLDVDQAILDPEFRFLHWTPQYRAEAPLLAPYWQALVKDESNQLADAIKGLEYFLLGYLANLLHDQATLQLAIEGAEAAEAVAAAAAASSPPADRVL